VQRKKGISWGEVFRQVAHPTIATSQRHYTTEKFARSDLFSVKGRRDLGEKGGKFVLNLRKTGVVNHQTRENHQNGTRTLLQVYRRVLNDTLQSGRCTESVCLAFEWKGEGKKASKERSECRLEEGKEGKVLDSEKNFGIKKTFGRPEASA